MDAETCEGWAAIAWQHRYADQHAAALAAGRLRDAWQLCEAFDAECLESCHEASGVCDPRLGQHRGCLPKKATVQPRRGKLDTLWEKFAAWLTWLGNWDDDGSLAAFLQPEIHWRLDYGQFAGLLRLLLDAPCELGRSSFSGLRLSRSTRPTGPSVSGWTASVEGCSSCFLGGLCTLLRGVVSRLLGVRC